MNLITTVYTRINSMLIVILVSGLCLTHGTAAVMMGFEEDTENHFIWNSGRLLPNVNVSDIGSFWTLDASTQGPRPAARIRKYPDVGAGEMDISASFAMLPLSGDGSLDHLSFDPFGFYSISATYHDAVPGEDIGNIRVEGWLTDPNAKDPSAVPEGSSTLPLLALGLLGFLGKTRRRTP